MQTNHIREDYVPKINEEFVPFGDYGDVKKALLDNKSRLNILIAGPKGCGKTQMVEHILACSSNPIIRVNITIESDEDSLMGGLRLLDGNTYFEKGPVIRAMELGIPLLLDEIDLGHPTKLMCLQSVLEHGAYHVKKTGDMYYPAKGFKVIATANTKGRGDESGQYIGTQILNSAMLDRFSLFFDWDYPDTNTERTILFKKGTAIGLEEKKIRKEVYRLTNWAAGIRSGSVENIDLEETISTRKLCDILTAFMIYEDLEKAARYSINGLDKNITDAFIEFLNTVDDSEKAAMSAKTVKQNKSFRWNVGD